MRLYAHTYINAVYNDIWASMPTLLVMIYNDICASMPTLIAMPYTMTYASMPTLIAMPYTMTYAPQMKYEITIETIVTVYYWRPETIAT